MKPAVARNGWGLGPAFGAAVVAVAVPLLSAIWMAPGRVGTLLTLHASGDSLIHVEISRSVVSNWSGASYIALAGLAVALLALFVVAVRAPAPRTRPSPRLLPALVMTCGAVALCAALAQIQPLSSNLWLAPVLFPVGLFLVPVAALCSARYATALAASLGLAAAGGVIVSGMAGSISLPGPDLMMFLAVLAGGLTAAATGGRAEHPAQLVTGGLLVGGAQGIAAAASCFLLLNAGVTPPDPAAVPPLTELGGIVGLGVALGAGQGALLRLLLPVLERMSSRISAITLARWADTHHPLLERLKREAPGTFHHSQAVGALAATCAREIGADPYISRVGGYYHDIGKIRRPDAFGENTPDTCHRELSPGESASLILAHVRDGADLAREYGLPQVLTDFIVQHHGTTVVEFFFNKAREAAKRGEGKSPRRDDYTYAGPRPQSIESALVMLADSAEAASRSLENPSVAEIRDIVEKIFRNKLGAFQFDECSITAAEMGIARDIIVRELAASRHTRPEYPDTEYPTQAVSAEAVRRAVTERQAQQQQQSAARGSQRSSKRS